jgi:hypothetical protein
MTGETRWTTGGNVIRERIIYLTSLLMEGAELAEKKISAPLRLRGIKNMLDRNFLLVHTAAKMSSKAI